MSSVQKQAQIEKCLAGDKRRGGGGAVGGTNKQKVDCADSPKKSCSQLDNI